MQDNYFINRNSFLILENWVQNWILLSKQKVTKASATKTPFNSQFTLKIVNNVELLDFCLNEFPLKPSFQANIIYERSLSLHWDFFYFLKKYVYINRFNFFTKKNLYVIPTSSGDHSCALK